MSCPSENQSQIDQSKFWDSNGLHWTTHRIGWAIAGGCAVLTVLISTISVLSHCRNYTNRSQQRQILRILYMPPVYGTISFVSYRFFRDYTYYSFIQSVYEAIGLSAFLLLLISYVAATAAGGSAEKALERKDKRPLPIPFCCWRYRPTKGYFMYTVKWSVLQYVIIRPVASIAGIVCENLDVLCKQSGFSFRWAHLYIECVNFISISIALYGLLVFYGLTAEELRGRRPMAKFLAIKLIVMFTFYQSFVFEALEGRVIHETQYWTETNISNGLSALTICVEMVLFALYMMWAYPYSEYKRGAGKPATSVWGPLWDSINYADFFIEIAGSLRYYWSTTAHHNTSRPRRPDFGEAFGVQPSRSTGMEAGYPNRTLLRSTSEISLPAHNESTIPLTSMDTRGSSKRDMDLRQSMIGIAR
ncbi:hypothetical protein AGABI2DRAFT_228341 [Agaricus bisporus var. bisporus H97]|uniref:hypothetical protein n=1 Tax=Agaricus bisporus var. bisporus (strain H97 / ATCC MYA-4626 / FGSC 10389) TaxID=936046 RepID=UPI00029F6C4B|nr:hypothetical protein AGABI2DRAFT_228341 [Agaricus bisporus var. bisporus H97]EKV42719.1 hypothetical protein AGABI2DRAFT_228341 [Agaricus bisporus var. bisporus H97]